MTHIHRRAFIGASAAIVALPRWARGQGAAQVILPSPRLTESTIEGVRFVSGLRPFRDGSYRLETETVGDQCVIHNYGHGGGGITLSWGCASRVVRFATAQRASLTDNSIAVLGAGVIGLTSAAMLQNAGFSVTVYADKFSPNTTSDVAGGQFAPSVVDVRDEDRVNFSQLVKESYDEHQSRGLSYGVRPRDNYCFRRTDELDYVAAATGNDPEMLERLPFARMTHAGVRYATLLIEPPVLMTKLMADCRAAGVQMVHKTFHSGSEATELDQKVVVNCLGLGSREVWNDTQMRGMKGTLAWLKPQPELNYLYSGIGYMFPRYDHLVIGGSIEDLEPADENVQPDPQMGTLMIKIIRAVFDGALPAPKWLSGVGRLADSDMRS